MMRTAEQSLLIRKLLDLMIKPVELRKRNVSPYVLSTFKQCLIDCVVSDDKSVETNDKDKLFEITSLLDYFHEELNTGHWSEIPIETRQNFTIASFVKAVLLLQLSKGISANNLTECLKCVDIGLLLGAPLDENPDMLTEAAKFVRIEINSLLSQREATEVSGVTKRKHSDENWRNEFQKVPGKEIDEEEIPSLEAFNKNYFIPQIPVKIKGCMSHWPASTKWLDLNYLVRIAGDRTVPIEIGSHYTDEDWSQKLMTLKEFITKHYLSETGDIGYLAQHNLFNQITELRDDIRIPEYCCCSQNYEESADPDINAWFGPKGTVSPLHQDPKNNILAQVYGTKQLLLYPPNDTDYLYPHEGKMLSNTAQVDPLNPDYEKFPNLKKATMYKCVLEPGEMLFIPVKWWHHVTALDKSFSVSFWWQ